MKWTIILCLMLCLIIPTTIEAKKKPFGNGLYWELSDNGVLTISGRGNMPNYAYDKYKNAPWAKKQYNKVIIEEGISSIGDYSFRFGSMSSIEIAPSVTIIGKGSFAGCKYLSSLNIPSSVIRIERYAFGACDMLSSVVIPNSVMSIGEYNQEIKGETNVEIIPVIA